MSRVAPPVRASRLATAALAVAVLAVGFAAHELLPPAVGGPAGDALYATLMTLLAALLVARASPLWAGAVGFAVSAVVEVLQLTGLPAAVVARVPAARYVLGSTFAASDLAWYALGALVGATLVGISRASWRSGHVIVRHGYELGRRRRRALPAVLAVLVAFAAAGGVLTWRVGAEAGDLRPQVAQARQVLADAEGRVADDATRTALAASIDAATATLAERPLLERRPGDARRAGDLLARRVDAVTTSRLTLARTTAATARDALQPVTARGETVLTATDGLGADEQVRGALATALDSAAASAAQAADDALGDATDPTAVERTASDLVAARDAVGTATVALLTAQDAVTCPEPDQVWFPEGGHLADDDLASVPWAPGMRVRADVLPSLVQLDDAFRARFGSDLKLNSAYRSYDDQLAVYDPAHPNPLAAPPGCSNHGLGTSVDIDGISQPGSAEYAWLAAHAGTYGWMHPDWAEPGGRLPEPWHWQSVLTPTSY
ncbi:DUF2809 domain-containing protein [Xylanimonas allomyrinae]|uniref:DUF2809 domain-containing protein n=1 Tax=Xylanimonas allomyrinae TaxID=2509459 RepID=A0A4P6ELA0_9MICO|nr:DUF2809 domain-containing protein [Xylanimonas allomyrinae]QAY63145.1 DUF2809 domain-containing protein [Xylanimonas allomyrinae]